MNYHSGSLAHSLKFCCLQDKGRKSEEFLQACHCPSLEVTHISLLFAFHGPERDTGWGGQAPISLARRGDGMPVSPTGHLHVQTPQVGPEAIWPVWCIESDSTQTFSKGLKSKYFKLCDRSDFVPTAHLWKTVSDTVSINGCGCVPIKLLFTKTGGP